MRFKKLKTIQPEELDSLLYTDHIKCNEFLSTRFDNISHEHVLFHFVWDDTNIALNRKHEACLLSFLNTQPINFHAMVWVNKIPKFLEDERIHYRIYDPKELAKDTPLENSGILDVRDDTAWTTSDIARLLILYKFGGIYYDFDNLFLKDLSPLMHIKEFVYHWPGDRNCICNAIIKSNANSDFIRDALFEIKNIYDAGKLMKSSHQLGRTLLTNLIKTNKYSVKILPCGFFHLEFFTACSMKATDEVECSLTYFKKNELSGKIYENCFSWHWHNKWIDHIEKDSKFDLTCKLRNIEIDTTRKVIIGTGTGRCGTNTLAALLALQSDTISSHELVEIRRKTLTSNGCMPININNERSIEAIDNMLTRRKSSIVADVSFYWVHFSERLIKEYNATIIYLKRDRSEVIESFKLKAGKRNHWQEHDGSTWVKHSYDVAFKKYIANDRGDAIGQYYDDCLNTIQEVKSKYPNNVIIFETNDLSNEQKCEELLRNIGYKYPIYQDLKLNQNKKES